MRKKKRCSIERLFLSRRACIEASKSEDATRVRNARKKSATKWTGKIALCPDFILLRDDAMRCFYFARGQKGKMGTILENHFLLKETISKYTYIIPVYFQSHILYTLLYCKKKNVKKAKHDINYNRGNKIAATQKNLSNSVVT